MKTRIRSHELLNGQEFSGASMANYIRDLSKKYGSYLSESLVSVGVYASMIIGVMRSAIFLNLLFQSIYY